MYRAPRKIEKYARYQGLSIIGSCVCKADYEFLIASHNDLMDIVGFGGGEPSFPGELPTEVGYITYNKGKYRTIFGGKPVLIAMAGITLLRNIDIPEEHWERIVSAQVMEAL